MAEKLALEQLSLGVAVHRERAAQARRLAAQISDPTAQHGLLQRANEQERCAEALEAQIAVLKEVAPIATPEPDPNIAVLKPSPATPASDRPDGTAT
jgi:hypothetical protein